MLSPSGCSATISARPSTWPETMWPPSSSPSRSARSRLTRRPSRPGGRGRGGRWCCATVSAEMSTSNQAPSPRGPAVDHGQADAVAGDRGADRDALRPGRPQRMRARRSPRSSSRSIVPMSVTIPVNMPLPRSPLRPSPRRWRQARDRGASAPQRGQPRDLAAGLGAAKSLSFAAKAGKHEAVRQSMQVLRTARRRRRASSSFSRRRSPGARCRAPGRRRASIRSGGNDPELDMHVVDGDAGDRRRRALVGDARLRRGLRRCRRGVARHHRGRRHRSR